MTQKDKSLNCLNCRIGDFKRNLCDCHDGFCAKYKGIGTEKDFFKAIEALQSNRPHGEWKQISPARIYECSECGQNVMTSDIEAYKFCHGCGARMLREDGKLK